MDLVYDLAFILLNNIFGIILAIVVYLYMRQKIRSEKQKSFYEGREDMLKYIDQKANNVNDMFNDYQHRVDTMSKELNHAFRCGIIKGLEFDSNKSAKDISTTHLMYVFDKIGSYNYYSRMPGSEQFKNEYKYIYNFDPDEYTDTYRENLNYAYKAGIIEGFIFEYNRKGITFDDNLIYSVLDELGDYRNFTNNKLKRDFADIYINEYEL